MTSTFTQLTPWLGTGLAPDGWRPITSQPLIILVGVTGVGKSTTVDALADAGLAFNLLPNRRTLTDDLIIAHVQHSIGLPIETISDREERFAFTRRYREQNAGGMAHALAQLWVNPADLPNGSLIFDGLRGENEVEHAAHLLPQARFLVLDAPHIVRVQRLLGRNDSFDQIQVSNKLSDAAITSLDELGVELPKGLFNSKEKKQLLKLAQSGEVEPDLLAAKLKIVAAEYANYDPATTITKLNQVAPARTLIMDTVALNPTTIATQVLTSSSFSPNSQLPTSNSLLIEHIETIPYRLPMHGTLRWGKASALSEARNVVVRVTLSDGSTGISEALPRPTIYGETVTSICAVIEQELAPRVIGEGAEPVHIMRNLHEIKNNQTAKGAIDVTLHHALAQSKGISLAEQIGAVQDNVRVSYILGIGDNDTMLAEAERVFNQGVRVFKVKVGRDWQADIDRLLMLQATLGESLDIYVDANETMSVGNAPQRLDQLKEIGVHYCEEALPIELIQQRADLRADNHLPIIGDDSCFSIRDLRRELALNTFDILNIKTARTGYTDSAQMLALAKSAGKGVMVGSHAAATLGASRTGIFAASAGIAHPSELTFFLKLKEDIVATPLTIADGYISLKDLLGVEVDEDLLRDARV